MTKVKSPNVSTVIGNERKINPGFTKMFSRATNKATSKAVQNESTKIPGSK